MSCKNTGIRKPVCLVILDGWGISPEKTGNAIALGYTPNMDRFFKVFPNTKLDASGEAVGLPEGQMGNSEVGHLNIGAGRVVYQEFTRINNEIKNKNFFKNSVLIEAIEHVLKNKKSLHLMGLVSDGGVHSHLNHLKALMDMAVMKGLDKIFIHAFLDGRDVPPRSAITYLSDLQQYIVKKGPGEIATVSGRYYSMDRDNRWERTEKSYTTMVYRKGRIFNSAVELVEDSYANGVDDEFVIPALVKIRNEEGGKISPGDSIVFFNFRPDRARQLTRAFISGNFTKFDRGQNPPETHFVCMTRYDKEFEVPVAFPPQKIKNTLGEVVSDNGLRQLRIAETEKYAHVTFFLNGGIEKPYPDEDRILIPSPKIATYDLKPEMSAYGVTDTVVEKIRENIYDVIIINFANADMVGHTGFLNAAIKAVEAVDKCVGKVADEVERAGGLALITADHGNAEEMICPENGAVITAHSTSPVPFIVCDRNMEIRNTGRNFRLSDIAPTVLKLLGISKPAEMTGESIIECDTDLLESKH
ncbi:MAG: 2,3-bisphosphoglycerate-independent phosphoglycerate mutase [Actinobacteria bacterium]|nr:2,3-bisphosphoglycerate-independent phosphoglycerate mutase [Actinomycetota bacterium]